MRNVRSVASITVAPSMASTARRMAFHSSGPAASTVMSRTSDRSWTSTRSIAPITPPASPMAAATSPSIPRVCSISTRSVMEYWALGEELTGAAD